MHIIINNNIPQLLIGINLNSPGTAISTKYHLQMAHVWPVHFTLIGHFETTATRHVFDFPPRQLLYWLSPQNTENTEGQNQ